MESSIYVDSCYAIKQIKLKQVLKLQLFSLIAPTSGFVLRTTGRNSVNIPRLNFWIQFFLYSRMPRETLHHRVVKASSKASVAIVWQWLSLPHYHSHHDTDNCYYLPDLFSLSCLPLIFSICFSPVFSFVSLFHSHLQPTLSLSLFLSRRCPSSVAVINLFRWKCKCVISWSTLNADEMVGIAQTGFSQTLVTPPPHRLCLPPDLYLSVMFPLYPEIWLIQQHPCSWRCVWDCMCLPALQYLKQWRRKQGESKHAISLQIVQPPPGLMSSKHRRWKK